MKTDFLPTGEHVCIDPKTGWQADLFNGESDKFKWAPGLVSFKEEPKRECYEAEIEHTLKQKA
jgi:hypothetical protein